MATGTGHAQTATQALPADLEAVMARSGIKASEISLRVQRIDQDAPILSFNDAQPRNPASVMKLITAFAALETLGPQYQWETEIRTSGTRHGDRLDGTLYIKGGNDPALTQERLWLLLSRLRARGIRHVVGGIVLDHSAIDLPPHDPGAFDGRPLRPYNAGPDALQINFNALQIDITPSGQPNTPPTLSALPALPGLTIKNNLQVKEGTCGSWYRDLDAEVTRVSPNTTAVTVSGSWRNACGPRDWNLSPWPGREFSRRTVQALWQQLGGSLGGTVRDGMMPTDATLLLTHTSPALAEILRDMGKWSNNLMARQIFATLGQAHTVAGENAVAAARRQLPQTLQQVGINIEGLALDNGAGLSRDSRVTVRTLTEVLQTAWQRPWMPEFVSALPLLGVDGTTQHRFENTPLSGRAHLKTGTLNGVSGIGGYLRDAHGHDWIVVMLTNTASETSARVLEDALLGWVWDQAANGH